MPLPIARTTINSENSLRPKPSWWQGLERSTVHPNLKSTLNRNDSTVPIPNSIKSLLEDPKFQNYFDQIWSDWNPHKENEKDVKFKIIELQRKLVQVLLQTMIDASAHLNQVQKIAIFNAVMHFLIDNRNSEHCWAYIQSWVGGICGHQKSLKLKITPFSSTPYLELVSSCLWPFQRKVQFGRCSSCSG
ncbi:hypothetical protein VP01_2809g3 [Puccinia sorghi]|uniref:Uncharacterized protein n=1 Tax=Puccinia sorghi TaxID=27349 RepID=A0A0L6V2H5_9BASI|nr:hypothetical protein VP01_2809g3 [Puccinia sorghi]